MPTDEIEIDPVKLMRWLNARKMTVPAFNAEVGADAASMDQATDGGALVWDDRLVARASEVLDVEVHQLRTDAGTVAAVYRSAASSQAQRRTVRRDGIDFYVYYSLAGPRGQVAPVILDILCPPQRLPELNQGHLEPAITVNLGPGDINGRWAEELTAQTWSVLSANRGPDAWITGDSYYEPSFCPHTYSRVTDEPARILSYTGASPLANLVDQTNTWSDEAFGCLLDDVGQEFGAGTVLARAMRRRGHDPGSLAAAAHVDRDAVDALLREAPGEPDLTALARLGRVLSLDYRLLLPPLEDRDPMGKSSRTIAESRASVRRFASYTVADMAGSSSAPDLLGSFLLVDGDTAEELDLRDPQATFYLVTAGSATASWVDEAGRVVQQALGRWDSLWIGPGVRHGFTGNAGMLRMGDASSFSYQDTLELSNTYRPARTLGRARQDRRGWGYDR
ncbi:cupin domain-containing protein [Nocardioides campestrisoli]|uniref:histidine kinase n=1 Tax=Nocardioides campestrisoli TaxID=2736757 RepID=UPI00163DE4D7|nr:histidine kinase [Nocardioides campestrisoli]